MDTTTQPSTLILSIPHDRRKINLQMIREEDKEKPKAKNTY